MSLEQVSMDAVDWGLADAEQAARIGRVCPTALGAFTAEQGEPEHIWPYIFLM